MSCIPELTISLVENQAIAILRISRLKRVRPGCKKYTPLVLILSFIRLFGRSCLVQSSYHSFFLLLFFFRCLILWFSFMFLSCVQSVSHTFVWSLASSLIHWKQKAAIRNLLRRLNRPPNNSEHETDWLFITVVSIHNITKLTVPSGNLLIIPARHWAPLSALLI